MVKVSIQHLEVLSMMANGKEVGITELVHLFGQMVAFIKGNGEIVGKMGKADFKELMVLYMKASGKMGSIMVKVN